MDMPDLPGADLVSGPKRLFVTKLAYAAGAVSDRLCQDVAESARLGGTWKAWLTYRYTSETLTAISRITSQGPWVLLNGEVAFQNHGQLATTPSVPIQITETKTSLPSSEVAWTGTSLGGGTSSYDCQAWAESRSVYSGTIGSVSSTTATWTNTGAIRACDNPAHVYCFEL